MRYEWAIILVVVSLPQQSVGQTYPDSETEPYENSCSLPYLATLWPAVLFVVIGYTLRTSAALISADREWSYPVYGLVEIGGPLFNRDLLYLVVSFIQLSGAAFAPRIPWSLDWSFPAFMRILALDLPNVFPYVGHWSE